MRVGPLQIARRPRSFAAVEVYPGRAGQNAGLQEATKRLGGGFGISKADAASNLPLQVPDTVPNHRSDESGWPPKGSDSRRQEEPGKGGINIDAEASPHPPAGVHIPSALPLIKPSEVKPPGRTLSPSSVSRIVFEVRSKRRTPSRSFNAWIADSLRLRQAECFSCAHECACFKHGSEDWKTRKEARVGKPLRMIICRYWYDINAFFE